MQKKRVVSWLCLGIMTVLFHCTESKNDSDTSIDQLKSLPYVAWTEEMEDESVSGVIKYNKQETFNGYNIFFNMEYKSYLIDMYGKIVHIWHLPYIGEWEYGIIKENGNLIAVCSQAGIVELDWYGNLLWETKYNLHHDVAVLKDGSYLVPFSSKREYKGRKVVFDGIQHISKKGELLDSWSAWDNLEKIKKYHPPSALDKEPEESENLNQYFDYHHLNTIQLLPFTWAHVADKRFKEGNWLICLRQVDLILIIDKDSKEIVWDWGPGDLDWPHMPVMLENGDILIFDNGTKRKYSRIVQINPKTKKIVWEYKTDPPEKFFSKYRGSSQRFSNGNTLITDSENGHVFEMNKEKEIVWEFFNFEIKENKRKRIYRMIRYPEKMIDSLLRKYPPKEESRLNVRIQNSSFEAGNYDPVNKPKDWDITSYVPGGYEVLWDNEISQNGKKSVKIMITEKNDVNWFQYINVKPHTNYRLSGWIKTVNIPPDPEKKNYGAKLAVTTNANSWPNATEGLTGDNDWTLVSCQFYTGSNDKVKIQGRLGFLWATTTGTAWFDHLEIEELGR